MNKFILGLVVVGLGVVVGWFVLGDRAPLSQQNTDGMPTPTAMVGSGELFATPEATRSPIVALTVSYTDAGFDPAQVTATAGSTVTFVNKSSLPMWVASGVHPTHQLLPGFDQLKSVGREGTYVYTFDTIGTWKYHNHEYPSTGGTVIVVE